jgi:hypothetical protein
MLYTQAIAGNPEAARFLSPKKPKHAAKVVTDIMEKNDHRYQGGHPNSGLARPSPWP